ncbi:MAG: phosphoribosylamine--glycine ligase [Candidatus Hydrogenedentes bacterium]|nr:phosphoribosylamine--glycine ligase [Candidatus Hydrogenedentota bacterium]
MNILLVGGGGREHALAWKIAQSPLVDNLYCAPGNAGISQSAECVQIDPLDFDRLRAFAKDNSVDLAVIGPERPLIRGLADLLRQDGVMVFGPSAESARLEGSKAFAKTTMNRAGVPTGAFAEFTELEPAMAYLREQGVPIVVKADGDAEGKGVTVARTMADAERAVRECLVDGRFGDAGRRVVIEECLCGEELSLLAFCDGTDVLPMVPSQDHKPAYDNDQGPNTGGMGAYSPVPLVAPETVGGLVRNTIEKTVATMAADGTPHSGVLYAGLMMGNGDPKVLEYNVRFGDPETQVIMPRMKSDIVPVLTACAQGKLGGIEIEWSDNVCVTVVMASGGYPVKYIKGYPIEGIQDAESDPDVVVFHAGTAKKDGAVVTNGGRVLNVTALAQDLPSAINKAYEAVEKIRFKDAHYRSDIGQKALDKLG